MLLTITLLSLTDKQKQSSLSQRKGKFSVKRYFDVDFLEQGFLIFLLGIMMSGIMAFTSIYAKQQGLTDVAWFFFAAAIAGVVFRLLLVESLIRKGLF